MPEDSRVLIILGRPFLATARAMIDVFNKKVTLRVGDDEVIFNVDQSIKKPPAEDVECYGIDDLDDTINAKAQELLTNDRSNSFLLKGLEKSINQSDLESCEFLENKFNNESDLQIPIRRINLVNTLYLVEQGTSRSDGVKSEHLYLASANEIDEKRPELKSLPNHLKYAYLQGDKSVPMIISSKLSEKEKNNSGVFLLDMSTSKTYQQSLVDAGSENRPPMLERGSYIPWASRFKRFLNRKRENRKWLLKALEDGPYVFRNITPTGSTLPRLQEVEDLQGDDLLYYDVEMELTNMILLSIPNEIYNSVDSCKTTKEMWDRVERLMRETIQNQVDRDTSKHKCH
ncbi:hypothetical protein Tco_0340327 [Tanacetum coccineum]